MNEQNVIIRTFSKTGAALKTIETMASEGQLRNIIRDLAEKGRESEILPQVLPLRYRQAMDIDAGLEVEFVGGLRNSFKRYQIKSIH